MKQHLIFFFFYIFFTQVFAGNTHLDGELTGKPKRKSSTNKTGSNDDPDKIHAFCMKYGAQDTFWLEVKGSECPDYQYQSITTRSVNPLVHFNGVGLPHTLTAPPQIYQGGIDGTSDYLLPFYFTIDAVGGNMSKEQLFTFEINMQPNGGTEIACARAKIKVHLYLSANDCQDNDTIFSVGRCYQCKAMNAQNDLYPVKYANFSMPQGASSYNIHFHNTSNCLPSDTLFWDFGDGTSEWRLASTPSIQHTYLADGAYTTTLTLKCGNGQAACRYKVKSSFFIHLGYFPVNDLQLTIGETGNPTEVQLRWTNQLAHLTHNYKLERKGKENQWITLADNLQEMEYLDTKLQYGVYHYRISAIDLEGKEVAMSEIQKVKIGGELVLFPNPVKEILSIAPPPYLNKVTTVRLLNLQGQVLQTFSILPNEIDMHTLPSGMYWLKLENDESYKIIKE